MRNDYFTTTELSETMHISVSTIHKYINRPGYFKGRMVGAGRPYYIIDKHPFFDWYFKAFNTGAIKQLLPRMNITHDAVVEEYNKYIAWRRNTERAMREAKTTNRPYTRRKAG